VLRAHAFLVVRLRWLVVVAWLAAAVFATLRLPTLQEAESASPVDLIPTDAEATRVATRSSRLFPIPVTAQSAVVQRDPEGLSAEAQRRVITRAMDAQENRDDGVAFAFPLLNTGRLVPASREEGTTAITFLGYPATTSIGDETRLDHAYAAQASAADDGLVGVTGTVPARLAEWHEISSGLPWVTLGTVLVVFTILALNYRSLLAPLLTLGVAGLAYLVAVHVAPWVGKQADVTVPSDVEPILVVLLLGIVTDYTVFFLSGMQRRLLAGEQRTEAALGATRQFLPIVLTAGLIVACGAASLLAGKLEFFRALGPGMALTVLVALAASITLVPALLAIFGRVLFWPSVPSPLPSTQATGKRRRRVRRVDSWSESLADFTTSKVVAAFILVLALGLIGLATRGLAQTQLGFTAIRGLPADSEERQAALAAEHGFGPGILAPTVLLVEQRARPLDDESMARLQAILLKQPGVAAVIGPATAAARGVDGLVVSDAAPAARFLIVLDREPHGGPAINTLNRLRDKLPGYLSQSGVEGSLAGFAGETALAAETIRTLTGDLFRIALAAFAVNFLLLVLFLRALVAPLYLLIASTLAFTATLGLTTFFFQTLLGHGELTYYVPLGVAALLVSLGSDYNVFLVGRIWQEARGRRVREAVAAAAPRASRTIAIAGVALALSFATLALIPLRQFREFAFAMTVGVLLDAFVVRSLLVPALISVFGELSWWPARRRSAAPATASASEGTRMP
jgi:putative drug exporter of the RND superfamily